MYAIDLFAGCGGLSKGFMDAGFDVIVGVDNDNAALETFKLNHKGAVALNADLSKQETFDEIKRIAGDRQIDVIIAGPPCQGFSVAGKMNPNDERNKLIFTFLDIVERVRPKAFVMENVKALGVLEKWESVRRKYLERVYALGYNCVPFIML